MKNKLVVLMLAAMLPNLSFGQGSQNYQCTFGDLQRRVQIFHETGVTVPCEVHYYKDTEAPGEQQVLWRAQTEAGYCERKTEEFITRLEELGWSCQQSVVEEQAIEQQPIEQQSAGESERTPESTSEPEDDTDALIPADVTEPADDM